jgi:hypothetical protein
MMSNGALVKVTAKTAAEIYKLFAPSDEAKKLATDSLPPKQALDLLIDKGQLADAVQFLAHALPKREAVWWACLCARAAAGTSPTPPISAALAAAEKWAREPREENRRATEAAAQTAGVGTPAGCAALAAFFSGGSLGPPHLKQPIPPGPTLTPRAVAGAIMLAAVQDEPEKAPEKYRKFLAQGLEVASGTVAPK